VGQPPSTYTYDSYGNLTANGTITNPYQYTGRENDPETGLDYYRARYYDPTVGRFISEDPSGFNGSGTNFYWYVRNSPTLLVDPSGLSDCVNGMRSLTLDQVGSYVGKPVKGSGTCVDFLKSTKGNYPTSTWRKGATPDANTPIGTFIATFYDDDGTKFANQSGLSHVGAWDGYWTTADGVDTITKGIVLIDQYQARKTILPSYIPYGGTRSYNNNASNYYVVMVPCSK
jgi:RHS repeat-associated protein